MRREKRSAQLRINVTQTLREEVEKLVAEDGVVSMSDYLFSVLDEHIEHVRIKRQRIGRRIGNQ